MGSGFKDRWPLSGEIVRGMREMLRSHKELSHNENDFQFHFFNKINNLNCSRVEMRVRLIINCSAPLLTKGAGDGYQKSD